MGPERGVEWPFLKGPAREGKVEHRDGCCRENVLREPRQLVAVVVYERHVQRRNIFLLPLYKNARSPANWCMCKVYCPMLLMCLMFRELPVIVHCCFIRFLAAEVPIVKIVVVAVTRVYPHRLLAFLV